MDGTGKETRPRAVIYVRVSSIGRRDRESASYQTEAEQRERCEAYAKARGLDVTATHSDIDVSGAKWERTGLDAVLALAKERSIDAVIVYRLSRLGRGLRGILDTVGALTEHGVDLMSVNEGLDLSTAAGRLTFNLLASVDEYERELRGEYWDATKRRARARGVLIGPTPYGYRRKADASLEPDPELAPIVREAYIRRAAGATLDEIAALMDTGKPSRSGRPRHQNMAARLLSNPIYRGVLPQDGGECPAIVTDDEWEAGRRPGPPKRRKGTHPFILTGIARCAECGGPMVGDSFSGVDRNTPVYVCRNRSRPKPERCKAPSSITAHRIEPWVLGIVGPVARLQIRSMQDVAGRLALLDSAARAADRELTFWVENPAVRARLTDAEWDRGFQVRADERDATAKAAAEARASIPSGPPKTWDDFLADPEALAGYLRDGAIVSLTVARGRGAVDERCTLAVRR